MTNKGLYELCERSFSPQVTMEQLLGTADLLEYMDWNVNKQITVLNDEHDDCVGMILKLDHENFSDMIMITLSWDDTYCVRFIDQDFKLVDQVEGLYFDQLFRVINGKLKRMTKFEFSLN